MARIHVDASERTFLPICRDCGWRGPIQATRLLAITSGARHERIAHPESKDALRHLGKTRRRLAKS